MVTQVPRTGAFRNWRVSAFLCGTLALALGLVLVLDPDEDDDQPLVLTSGVVAEARVPTVTPQAQKTLKVASNKGLRPKRTALKKRSKRFFHMHESGPPVQANQRPRRGFTHAPYVAIPNLGPPVDVPLPILARRQPDNAAPFPTTPQRSQQLIRGPPAPRLA